MDRGARALLARVYAAPGGTWVTTRLADPGPELVAWAARLGINVRAADPAKAAVGTRLNRWAAGFERSLYYNHRGYFTGGRLSADRRLSPARTRALVVEFGAHRPALG